MKSSFIFCMGCFKEKTIKSNLKSYGKKPHINCNLYAGRYFSKYLNIFQKYFMYNGFTN